MLDNMPEIYIWQRPVRDKMCFLPVDYDTVDLRDFVLVYYEKRQMCGDIMEALEELFDSLNENQPANYHARALSTSDLIMIRDKENRINVNYVVDLIGFKKVKITGVAQYG